MTKNKMLQDKVCLVTGTSRGIGKTIVEEFAKEGALVYANAQNQGSIDDWCDKCSAMYQTKVKPIYFDVTDFNSDKSAFMQIKKESGKLDVLVNNAGITSNQLIGMISQEVMLKLFEVNVFAVVELLQLAARLMMKQKNGSIINISSIIGEQGGKGELVYSGTKGAVISMTKSAAKELAPYRIRVNSIAPGMTDTDMFHQAAGTHAEEHISNIGFGRLAQPLDIANACLFLASDRAGFISGQILGVNGCSNL